MIVEKLEVHTDCENYELKMFLQAFLCFFFFFYVLAGVMCLTGRKMLSDLFCQHSELFVKCPWIFILLTNATSLPPCHSCNMYPDFSSFGESTIAETLIIGVAPLKGYV